jgi:hypothetical protein
MDRLLRRGCVRCGAPGSVTDRGTGRRGDDHLATQVSSDCEVVSGAHESSEGGVARLRGSHITCAEERSDPRLSGTKTVVYNKDCSEGGAPCVYRGSQEVTGPDGTWSGWANGLIDPHHGATGCVVMVSSGGRRDHPRRPRGSSRVGSVRAASAPPRLPMARPARGGPLRLRRRRRSGCWDWSKLGRQGGQQHFPRPTPCPMTGGGGV